MKKTIFLIIIMIAILSIASCFLFFHKNDNKKNILGNNKTIKEIEQYLLSIDSYKAEIEVTINSNKNENKYKLNQEVNSNYAKQTVLEPEDIAGMEIIYQDNTLTIKNTELNIAKVYENYPYVKANILFLTDFLQRYRECDSRRIEENNDKVELRFENSKDSNSYNQKQILTIDKNSIKPISLEVQDMNNNTKVYILYNEIEFNI